MADYSDYKECTDCVHYELCLHQEKFLIEHNRKDLIRRYGFGLSEPEICCNFRDRSRFVELPCKAGDIVYLITDGDVSPVHIDRVRIDEYSIMFDWYNSHTNEVGSFNLIEIGRHIYLSGEEAEQALNDVK